MRYGRLEDMRAEAAEAAEALGERFPVTPEALERVARVGGEDSEVGRLVRREMSHALLWSDRGAAQRAARFAWRALDRAAGRPVR